MTIVYLGVEDVIRIHDSERHTEPKAKRLHHYPGLDLRRPGVLRVAD